MDAITTKEIKLFATLRDVVGQKAIDIPFQAGQTVRQVLATVAGLYPALGAEIMHPDGELTGRVHILVAGRNIRWLDGLDTVVLDENSLVLLPPSAGG